NHFIDLWTNASSGMGVADQSKATYMELQRVLGLTIRQCFPVKDNFVTKVLVIRSPSVSRIRSKMLYATSKDRFRRELQGIHYEIQATDPTEVELEVLKERAY
ncbi:hypothetical protein EJD97_020763, partial [Solanum chilense]